jgi:hypothetical protein
MYARVSHWEGGTAEEIERMQKNIEQGEGPPEGVPAKGFMMLADRESGRGLAIALFESEEDLRTGDAKLSEMSPPAESRMKRGAVEMYEVVVDVRS